MFHTLHTDYFLTIMSTFHSIVFIQIDGFASGDIKLRILYTALFYMLVPFVLIRILTKSIRNPAYLKRISERFGFFVPPAKSGGIWVQSVSVGDTIAAAPLIKRLQRAYPD